MKKRILSIALALLMCMTVTLPTFADSEAESPSDRAGITVTYGLTNVSGSSYRMWAKIINLSETAVYAKLTLYDASYNQITFTFTISSNPLINLNKNITLSSGTYHVRLMYIADGASHTYEKTYSI
ncbi:MAG: hypothetical protein II117_00400 [Clostridia bacterium]|nr:hypothetical protein [Clostridia bacterium]